MNETRDRVLRLVERTPPEIPTTQSGFRTKLFDANGDGTFDIWLALRGRNFLNVTLDEEAEPNDSAGGANVIEAYPALRTGAIGGPRSVADTTDRAGAGESGLRGEETELRRDLDYFTLPERARSEGARIRLRPATDTDLMMTLLDADGLTVAIAQNGGSGAVEEIVVPAGTTGTVVHIDRQSGTTQGAGSYRLEMAPVAGFQVAPEPPLALTERARMASSTGDACHPKRQPPPRVSHSNP
jgi:hypothetical protein